MLTQNNSKNVETTDRDAYMQANAAMTDGSFDEDISFDTTEYGGKKQLDELN